MKILRDSQGLALFIAIFVMAIILLFLGASLFLSGVDTKISGNLKLAAQAIQVADAGLQHAMAVIEKGYDFDKDLNSITNCGDPPTPPCTLVANTTFPPNSGFSYTVTVENDSPDINNSGSPTNDTDNIVVLTSTAAGPNDTKRVVQAYVNRSLVNFTPPGAIYIPASSVAIDFGITDTFLITGDDTDIDGSPAANPKPAITGMAPIYNPVKNAFLSALGFSRLNLVQGSGYSADPINPSVITTSDVIDINQIALNFYNHPNAVKFLSGLNSSCSAALPEPRPSPDPCILGTDASPQITYLRQSGSNDIQLKEYAKGSGVLVTEGKTNIMDNFNFRGLLVNVKVGLTGGGGGAHELILKGDTKLFGGLLVGPTNGSQTVKMNDNVRVYYSSQALTMANNLCGSCLPQPARVFAWVDK